MIPEQIKTRLKFVEATKLVDRASAVNMSRRETNNSIVAEDDGHSEKFDTFFDYEDELSGLKPAGEQYASAGMDAEIGLEPFAVMEEESSAPEITEESFIEMEAEERPDPDLPTKMEEIVEDNIPSFIRCEFIKKNGEQCKRQAPKNGILCSSHRPK